ncbi:MAG: RMD1 family protein, partial [Spirochaetes bacterium]|nr:RMD1 family protein [Spirochaetota bacterium]
IHTGLIRVFDLKSRFKEVQASFKNIEENLAIFIEVHQHKMSNILEWIIIILILIEVVDLFITKIF